MSEEIRFDPIRLAQKNMRAPEIRRFYALSDVCEVEGGWALRLDGRVARTPAKARLIAPRRAITEGIAEEWAGQGEVILPATMPLTRLANSAIDGVARQLDATRAEIARYAGADLMYYRADQPEALAARQAAVFDPVLAWATQAFGARFVLSAGLTHVAQPEHTLAAARAAVEGFADPFAVAALHGLASLSGSLWLALAVARGAIEAEAAWRAARVDEDFQIEKWGEDEEATARRAARWKEFAAAARVARVINGFAA
jgi:chaperone required for assembly of F1-ATPase